MRPFSIGQPAASKALYFLLTLERIGAVDRDAEHLRVRVAEPVAESRDRVQLPGAHRAEREWKEDQHDVAEELSRGDMLR